MGSFSAALSGLSANSTAIDVVGNNLANLNTPGFKADTVTFQDLVTESIGAGLGSTQVGFGVGTPITIRQFSQGALTSTGGPLDAAIQGDGFFIVQAAVTGNTEYTRGGSFEVNTQGNLTTASGDLVQGWNMVNGVLDTNLPVGNITVPVGALAAPQATTSMSTRLNLDAAAVAGTASGTFSTSVQVYDSLGTAHTVTATFTQSGTANQWNYSLSVPDSDLATPPFTPVTGTLTFDSSGNLISPASTDAQPQLEVTGLADGAADMNVTWNLWNGTTPDISQYDQASAASAQTQNGAAAANLVSVGSGQRRPGAGAVFRRAAGGGGPDGHGGYPQSGFAGRGRKQQLSGQRINRAAGRRAFPARADAERYWAARSKRRTWTSRRNSRI